MHSFRRTFADDSCSTYFYRVSRKETYVEGMNQAQLVPKCTRKHKISKERNDVLRTTLLCDNDVDIGSMLLANTVRLCSCKIVEPIVDEGNRTCTKFADWAPQTHFRQIQKEECMWFAPATMKHIILQIYVCNIFEFIHNFLLFQIIWIYTSNRIF